MGAGLDDTSNLANRTTTGTSLLDTLHDVTTLLDWLIVVIVVGVIGQVLFDC